ncbi:MerR family transcriptional regulator [Nocardioides sp. Kera G14]|uniref:transcriptional regulator FtsR n=1 Tax=Nocardioides sp. Kera G14 TaxID=2884264 RepID=UPI001D10AA26|nr:MerR family transcriptional regulator [Nocardioides sp. Kera G14]UDY25244.1 MerR family transcriptional regulator [Nocardioides sp. Kera G14]
MAATAAHAHAGDSGERFNIGRVLDLLAPEFPGRISIPKIRLLEDDGLINPERTPAGYRKFSDADVERIRYILTMQRDHHLPKKVIAEHLDAIDRGLQPPAIMPTTPTVPDFALGDEGLPTAELFERRDNLRLSRKEVLKVAEVSEEFLAGLEDARVVSPSRSGHYTTDDLALVRAAQQLSNYGFHAAAFRVFRNAADREADLVRQAMSGRRDADEVEPGVAALAAQLHGLLLKSSLRG